MSDILWSVNGKGRVLCCTLEMPVGYWPVTVRGGDEKFVWRRRWQTSLPTPLSPYRLWTFCGLDRGDIVETELNIETHDGIPIFMSSFHKEAATAYEGWRTTGALDWVGKIQKINIIMSCRVNGKNAQGELSARYHAGIRLVGADAKDMLYWEG